MSGERCQKLLASLLEYSCERKFAEQMAVARELFTVATGMVTDEDPFYDLRMAVFQEYFVFDFRLSEIFPGGTVFEEFLWSSRGSLSPDEVHEYEQLRSVRRSIFVAERAEDTSMLVTDLVSRRQERIHALPRFSLAGFDRGRVFEGRTLAFEGVKYFTGSFILHAEGIRSLIEKRIREHLMRHAGMPNENWREQLLRRDAMVAQVTEKKSELEQSKNRKSVQVLSIGRELMAMAQNLGCDRLVMGLGVDTEVSPYITEVPFYDVSMLLDSFAYSEIRCHRYRHIEPAKLYASAESPLETRKEPTSVPPAMAAGA